MKSELEEALISANPQKTKDLKDEHASQIRKLKDEYRKEIARIRRQHAEELAREAEDHNDTMRGWNSTDQQLRAQKNKTTN